MGRTANKHFIKCVGSSLSLPDTVACAPLNMWNLILTWMPGFAWLLNKINILLVYIIFIAIVDKVVVLKTTNKKEVCVCNLLCNVRSRGCRSLNFILFILRDKHNFWFLYFFGWWLKVMTIKHGKLHSIAFNSPIFWWDFCLSCPFFLFVLIRQTYYLRVGTINLV